MMINLRFGIFHLFVACPDIMTQEDSFVLKVFMYHYSLDSSLGYLSKFICAVGMVPH